MSAVTLFLGAFSAFKIKYRLENNSKLVLKGTSNLTNWSCVCNNLQQEENELEFNVIGNKLIFSNGVVKIKTNEFNCGKEAITRDMHKTLKSQFYPNIYIHIEELNVENLSSLFKTNKKELKAKGRASITIAGSCRTVNIEVSAKKLKNNQYHFYGINKTEMTTFGIDPPSTAFGLVKVGNEIEIVLDLVAKNQ